MNYQNIIDKYYGKEESVATGDRLLDNVLSDFRHGRESVATGDRLLDNVLSNSRYKKRKSSLKTILLRHSRAVADRALMIAEAHPEMNLDRQFVEEAAMLHDIGIFLCDAPGIACYGTYPYICHGWLGAELLRKEGYPLHARICERHTGAGLTKKDISGRNLPLPNQDFLPETLTEQLICYADKFYSKSHLDVEKTYEQAERSLAKFGEEGVVRFRTWRKLFE